MVSVQKGDEQVDGGNFVPEAVRLSDGKFAVACGNKLQGAADYTAAGVFTGGLVALEKGGKWGYVNSKGKEVIPFEFDAIDSHSALGGEPTAYECSEGYVTVCKGGKYGVYKADGTQVIPCQYSAMTTVHDGRVFASNDGGVWGILLVDKQISDGIALKKAIAETTE